VLAYEARADVLATVEPEKRKGELIAF